MGIAREYLWWCDLLLLEGHVHLHGQVLLLHLEPLLIVEDGRVVQIEIPALIVVEFLVFRFASVDVTRL